MSISIGRSAVFACMVLVIVLLGSFSQASAGVIRHDVADSNYLALTDQTIYAPVGKTLSTETSSTGTSLHYLASGVLISDTWVLTAAHVIDGAGLSALTFDVGGDRYTADLSTVAVHGGWSTSNLLGGNDIALFQLTASVTGVAPARLYNGSDDEGLTGTSVGFDRTGTGQKNVGSNKPADTKRAGQNVIDVHGGGRSGRVNFGSVSANIIFSDFDKPDNDDTNLIGDADPLDLEYLIAPGDSGGGVFLVDPDDDLIKVVGIHSFGARLQGGTPEAPIGDQDQFFNSSYGEMQGSTFVPGHIGFIETTTSLTLDSTGQLVPEPATMTLLVMGSMGMLMRRRRRRY